MRTWGGGGMKALESFQDSFSVTSPAPAPTTAHCEWRRFLARTVLSFKGIKVLTIRAPFCSRWARPNEKKYPASRYIASRSRRIMRAVACPSLESR